jgi:glycosyltransferase involved in cell wall biosynthesis
MQRSNQTNHIAFCISSFRVGGGERVTIDLANEFARLGHSVDLISLQDAGEYRNQIDPQVRLIVMQARRMFLSLPQLVRYLKRESPEVLLANDEHTQLYSILAKIISGAPTRIVGRVGSMYSRILGEQRGWKKVRLTFILNQLYPKLDMLIAVSKGVRDDIISVSRIDPARVVAIYNPKDIADIMARAQEPVAHEWFTNKSLPIVVGVGRFRNIPKNFQLLIRAFARVQKEVASRLVLVGRGQDEDRMRALAGELGCAEAVLFAGYTDNPYAYVAKSDVYVMPSLWEGMPNGPIEALICGTPVIASDCASGPREILAPDTDYRARITSGVEYAPYGVLTAVNDEDALVEALTRLLTDETMRSAYRKKGRERAEAFSGATLLGEYAKALGIY